MVSYRLAKRSNELGHNFHKEFAGNYKVINRIKQLVAEIDAYLENETTIAVSDFFN
ncbi:MAG: hypothetical protein LBC74_10925 [Planctomycetaceae bacterium]|nr:hypothetical protein [Planctomycetaceae bacterium]